jgi:hypothetical protein
LARNGCRSNTFVAQPDKFNSACIKSPAFKHHAWRGIEPQTMPQSALKHAAERK